MSSRTINLNRSYGWTHGSVKDLISDLKILDEVNIEDDVKVILPVKERVSPVTLTMIWVKLRAFQTFKCKTKALVYSTKSEKHFNETHFFDRLSPSKVDKSKGFLATPKIPFHFNTFNISEDENTVAYKIADKTHEKTFATILGKEAKIHILELVSNAFHHSLSKTDVGCLSNFSDGTGNFDFCIADQGDGIKQSFARNKSIWEKYSSLSVAELLEKATEQNITCNPKDHRQYSHRNSGMGLYWLKEFCRHHGGHIVIISGNGYY